MGQSTVLDADELLQAAAGDREEALRMLFVLARRCVDEPDQAHVSGPELAAVLEALLRDGLHHGQTWTQAHQLVTVCEGPPPTAADVADAIGEVLHGSSLELAPASERYLERDLLGVGGMGQVHRVVDIRLRRAVARKSLNPGVAGLASAGRFALEAQLTAQLDHPNIVPLYDFDRDGDGQLYFTMKEVQGRSLADAIDDARFAVGQGASPGPLILRLVRVFRQVCDGVAFAHEQGIAHRDLKPSNVMIGDFGEVLVMDWGLAQRFGVSVSTAGTPQYMAPELAAGEVTTAGPGPDVYALGATLYHLLALVPPYEAGPQLLERVASEVPPPPSVRARHAIPEELEAVALRAMARDPADRYPGVTELAEEVQAWLDGRPLSSVSYTPGALLAKWARRNRSLVLGVGGTLLVALVLGAAGGVRYVLDVTEARDEARRQQGLARSERDRARDAEVVARTRLVEAQLAAGRAATETGRYTRADERYRAAAAELEELGGPQLGPQLGRLDNHERAERPLFALDLLEEPGFTLIERENGWVVPLQPGKVAVAREPPLFEARWTSAVEVPRCRAAAARWEVDTLALYCADDAKVDRVDLGTGERREVVPLEGLPVELAAPAHTDLLFVGHGDLDHWAKEPMLSWRAVAPEAGGWRVLFPLDVNEIPSARGPWFVAERYARGHGTVLYHRDRGAVRTVGLPLAKGAISRDGRSLAAYHEGTYELFLEPLEGGPRRWAVRPENPVVVWGFGANDRTLYAAGATPTILEYSTEDGTRRAAYDGHTGPVREVLATEELVLGRGLDGRLLGFSRVRPSDRYEGSTLGLLPPGNILVVGDGPVLRFVDVATRRVLREVELPLEEGETWEAESLQPDGALVVSPGHILFVPLAGGPVETLATADGRPLAAGDRLPDGHLAFCRGAEVVLVDPDGAEHALGPIDREICRDLKLASRDTVFVSDFWGYAVHRFDRGRQGPTWTRLLEFTVFRLSVGDGLVAVGDWTGRATVWEQETGEVVLSRETIEGPALGTALEPEQGWLAVGGWDHRLTVLDLATGEPLAEDARHGSPVEWIAWSADRRMLASAEAGAALLRDLGLPDRLDAATEALTDLAVDPERPRTGEEWAGVARGLAVHGLWRHALSVAPRAEGLTALEQARWHWQRGSGAEAARWFAVAREVGEADAAYLSLCESAARESGD